MKHRVKPVKNVNQIIIRLPNFLGDSIMSTPAIKLLLTHYPNARLTIVCKNPSQEIFKTLSAVEKIIIDDTKNNGNRLLKTIRLISEIRKEKYDLGVLFHNNFINALIFRLARIKHLVGYNNGTRKFLLTFHIKIDRTRHYINHYANLINRYLENKYRELPPLGVWSKGEEIDFGFSNNLPVVGLGLGSDVQGNRAYPKEHSWKLVKMLLESKVCNLVFIGDKNDAKRNDIYCDQITDEQQKHIRNYSGKTDVGTYINLINQMDVLVTVDSSAMHIAAATGTPFLVVLGRSTSAFSCVQPKVSFGRYIKNENNLIDDDLFISQIKPKTVFRELEAVFGEIKKNQHIKIAL